MADLYDNMATDIRNKYHIAINTIGYILRGAPNSPAYTRSVIPSQVNRLAISDINYSDFAGTGLFYTAQTDWSGGIKSESVWRDDAKFYYSSNINAYSTAGELKVENELELDEEFSEDTYCGAAVTVGGTINSYVGTYKASDANIKIYKNSAGTWSDIASTTFHTNQNSAAYVMGHKDLLWVGTVGLGDDDVIESYDGSSWTDNSATILAALTGWASVKASRAAAEVGGILYAGVDDYLNNNCAIVSTDDAGTTWAVVKDFGYYAQIVAMTDYNSKLYYLLYDVSNRLCLRVYDPSSLTDIEVRSFSSQSKSSGVWDKLLRVFNGKLVITTYTKIYEYDGSNLEEIFLIDPKKTEIGKEADSLLRYGCIEKDSKLYWGNLIYDGESFFNHKKPLGDGASDYLYPLFIDSANNIYYKYESSDTKLYKNASTYKATTAKNFLVFSEMSPVVSIDKLLYSITAIFEKMVSGDEIKIEYSINNRATWATAATLTYTTEGGTNTKREIIIPGNILFNKIWWRVSMANTGGATSPALLDLIMAYRPMPDYKNQWQVRLNMSDGVKLLNRQNDERDGADLSSQLWNEKLVKRKVKFQDIDYVECSLKTAMTKTQTSAMITSAKKLPVQGRIRSVSGNVAEEMYYTSAKADRIMGITRGARGTTARAYLSGQVLDNGYDVYVEDITTSLNFTDEEKTESIAQVLLIES